MSDTDTDFDSDSDLDGGEGQPYVMIGFSTLFGDYCDTIHALGGYLKGLYLPIGRGGVVGDVVEGRVAKYRAWAERTSNPGAGVEVKLLEDFEGEDGDRYLFGFRMPRLAGIRDRLIEKHGIEFETLVHPTAYVSPTAELGRGVYVGVGAIVASFVVLEEHVFINRGANIGHDAHLGPFTNVSPEAALGSGVVTGFAVDVGIGATVKENVKLGARCRVAGGAMVLRDVEPDALVAGVPAVFKKRYKADAGGG